MRKEKLETYNLTGSIHTLQLKTTDEAVPDAEYVNNKTIKKFSRYSDGETVSLTLNPNKAEGDIFDYGDFKRILRKIFKRVGIENYNLLRVDFRLDNYETEHYEKFQKLNRYLISLMAVSNSVKNKYRTMDLFSQQQISIAIKNEFIELENYDRNVKNQITGNTTELAQARLEERTKSRQWRELRTRLPEAGELDRLCKEFTEIWSARWEKAIGSRQQVHDRYNEELVKIYLKEKDAYPVQFRSLTDFLLQYQNSIFCRTQMIDLLTRLKEADTSLEYENAERKADNFKRTYGIEYFSLKDIKTAVQEIKNATDLFFKTLYQ